MPAQLSIGIIGLGFMGRTHAAAYQLASSEGFAAHLAAVCDPNAQRLTGLTPVVGNINSQQPPTQLWDPSVVKGFTDVDKLLASDVSLVSICTHTDSHVEIGIRALRAGKHVLVEKPVSLSSAQITQLEEAANAANRLCIPAMCMRYWPGWVELHDAVKKPAPEMGQLRSLTFQRLGTSPAWGGGFYQDDARSGGVLFDLHIHDVDFLQNLLGPPLAVNAIGDSRHVTTQFYYAGGTGPVHVCAEGAWDLAPSAGFRMHYLANFEHATLDFDLARSPQLMLHSKDSSTPVAPQRDAEPPLTGYDYQARAVIRHVLAFIHAQDQLGVAPAPAPTLPTLADARRVTDTLGAISRSLKSGRPEQIAYSK